MRLLTLGGTPLLAMHKYAPESVLLIFGKISSSPSCAMIIRPESRTKDARWKYTLISYRRNNYSRSRLCEATVEEANTYNRYIMRYLLNFKGKINLSFRTLL